MEVFSTTLRPDPGLLRNLRHILARQLQKIGLPEEHSNALIVATHEAVANAIQHSPPTAHVDVKAELEERTITVEVTNQAPWQPSQPCSYERGRGLALISALMTDVDIQTDAERTTL